MDYKEVLSSDAGRRVLGSFFDACGMTRLGGAQDAYWAGYDKGLRDAGTMVANSIREIDPRLVGECELAFQKMKERSDADHGRDYSDEYHRE